MKFHSQLNFVALKEERKHLHYRADGTLCINAGYVKDAHPVFTAHKNFSFLSAQCRLSFIQHLHLLSILIYL